MARVFADLNVLISPGERNDAKLIRRRLQAAFKLGYETVALTTVVEDAPSKSKKAKGGQQIPPVVNVSLDGIDLGPLLVKGRTPKVLNRITLVVSDPSHAHKLTSPAVKAYDIIAVQPTTDKTFQMICNSVEIDIISLDLTTRSPLRIRRQQTGLAMSHGLSFEINYCPAIRDRTARQNTISNAGFLVEVCKGKNIILSSGAIKAIEFRGPYDVANLGLLFGLSEDQAKDASSTNCRSLLLHAESRRLGRGVVSVSAVSELPPQEAWKAEASAASSCHIEEDEEEEEEEEDQEEAVRLPVAKKKKVDDSSS